MDGTSSATQLAVSTLELAAQITELAGHLNAANRRWLALIAEFDRRRGWSDSLTHSCAHWLNWQCGIALGAAREKVRVACEATEPTFLSIALHGTAHHVETIVRHYRRATEAAELSRESRQQASRKVTYYWDDDGSLVLKARLPAETGALVLRALEAAEVDVPLPDPDVPAETSIRPGLDITGLGCERTPRTLPGALRSMHGPRRPVGGASA